MDLIPDVIMPEEAQPPPQSAEPLICDEPDQCMCSDGEEEEQIIPEPEIKEPLKQEEVFKVKKMKKVIPEGEPPPKIQPVQKKKRVMSEKQKEALAKGREKALATRRKNAQLRKEEKELKSKKKKNDLDKLRKEVNGTSIDKLDDDSLQEVAKKAVEQPQASKKLYTLEDLKEAQEEAIRKGIEGYDGMRKKRKAEKKKKIAKETHDKKVFQDISRATRQPNPDDVWAVCFQ
jgi:NADH dehydrogenase/NADH:ubiquinone oxidoreductase subunit G